ncbi:MAG: PEGA domain-containing protein [Deltaproteobacteria bacterium]|nr:MAG: PEGA domain-containing protein [Deltaproteobacteria bacterium]
MTLARPRVLWPWSLTLLLALAVLPRAAHAQANCPGNKPGRYAVKIDSAPPGAAIYINDKSCPPVGVTPWEGKLNNADYTVILEAPGYDLATRPFKVARVRKSQDLFVPLVKKLDPPKIDVRADADKNVFGATVLLDGQPQGQAPMILTTTPGRHQVQLRKEGFEEYSAWLETKDNQVQTFAPTIKEIAKPKYGTVVVDADVPDAEVYIDGNKHPDNTPAVISNVIEGLHVIEVKKAPGLPWKQTIEVKASQQTKVRADLAATMNGGVGVIRVLSDAQGARAFIDGTDMGPVPVDIKDVKAGEHIVQVKAPGFQPSERRVMVTAGGSQIVKFDLNTEAPGDQGLLSVHSNLPRALVSIDGADVGTAPQEKRRVAPGEHAVLVRLEGYKQWEQKVLVPPGQTVTVQADLKAVGRLRVLSTPPRATVMVNGVPAGQTPLDAEVEVGETVVRIEQAGFQPFEQTLNIQGGKTEVLTRELAVAGPSEAEMLAEQRGLSSFGARVLPRGRSTVDLDGGYPYFLTAKITVGAGRIPNFFGFDASVGVRSMLARSEIGLGARMTMVDNEPFSAGAFTNLWWGSKLLDDSKRNGVTWDVGGLVSLTALTHVTITGRGYFELWSDRHCPALDSTMPNGYEGTDPIGVCKDMIGTMPGRPGNVAPNPSDLEKSRVKKLIGSDVTGTGSALLDRENGARFLLSIVAEIAFQQEWNIYFVLEGAPFQQSERALFTSLFSGSMADNDYRIYARAGLTYKF